MAAVPRPIPSRVNPRAEPPLAALEGSSLDRLKALHGEAEETARLANLLGRSFYATIALGLASAATLAFADTGLACEAAWAMLMVFAIAALARAYRHTIAQPFERAALRSFAEDLNAILLYAGFSWGAGAFLALAGDTHPVAVLLFSAGMSIVLAAILRKSVPVLYFIAPVALLSAASVLLRALPGDLVTALAVVVACGLVAGASAAVGYREAQARRTPLFGAA